VKQVHAAHLDGEQGNDATERPPNLASEFWDVTDEFEQIDAARRDPRSFAPLYDAYVDLVWRYALRRLGSEDRAAEATSMTFARALAALPAFRPRRRGQSTTFRSWLMTIARHSVIDLVRCDRANASLDEPHLQPGLVDAGPSPEEAALAREERERVRRALSQLPETQRQIVELRLIGMRTAEIADILGMSQSAINTAHFRAYTRLRDLLTERVHE
jgi:RNA polymerase sigma-70 factor (ECF subfamily)